ncbi:MAG: alpha/beta fold hydrolase [Saprospiraceae bacterium]|nr:alpha/beta fold hydrolase [Saprospiraceae bacterium]
MPCAKVTIQTIEENDGTPLTVTFFDLDFIDRGGRNVIILLHGLEGSSSSQYILGVASAISGLNADICAVNHRSCSGEINATLGFYHSGFTVDLIVILEKLSERYEGMAVVGFSLGGNMLLKYLGSHNAIPANFKTGIAVSVPVDLSSSAVRLNHWTNRPYAIQFLKMLRKKAIEKAKQFPDNLDPSDYKHIDSLYEYDNKVTAPLHGYADAEDYYAQASSLPNLAAIKLPALLINADDDSFLAPPCMPYEVADGHAHFHFFSTRYGGHVGYAQFKNGPYFTDSLIVQWLEKYM